MQFVRTFRRLSNVSTLVRPSWKQMHQRRCFAVTPQPNPPIELQTTEVSPNDFTDTDKLFSHKKVRFLFVGKFMEY